MAKSHHVDETGTDSTERPKRQRRINATKRSEIAKASKRQTPKRRVVGTRSRTNPRPLNTQNNRAASTCSAAKKARR